MVKKLPANAGHARDAGYPPGEMATHSICAVLSHWICGKMLTAATRNQYKVFDEFLLWNIGFRKKYKMSTVRCVQVQYFNSLYMWTA